MSIEEKAAAGLPLIARRRGERCGESESRAPALQGVLVLKVEWFGELQGIDWREQTETAWSLKKGSAKRHD